MVSSTETVMQITAHADVRMNQRGITRNQFDLILEHGEPEGDKLVLTAKNARERIGALRREMKRLEAVANKGGISVVMDGEMVITTYRTASSVAPIRKKVRG